jgi:hypothetical protein
MKNDITSWSQFVRDKPTFVEVFSTALVQVRAFLQETVPPENDATGALLWRFLFASFLDCDDILHLIASDSCWGSLKILRSLFERTVTAKYLFLNPGDATNFYEFDAIDWKSAMDAIDVEAGLTMKAESRANLEKAAADARVLFKLEPCITCGRGGRQPSWTPRSVKELSEKTDLQYMYYTAWILPTKLIHPTFYGLEQVILSEPPVFNTLYNVHSLLIELILIHQRHFVSRSEPTQLMTESVKRFLSVWTISKSNFGLPLQYV